MSFCLPPPPPRPCDIILGVPTLLKEHEGTRLWASRVATFSYQFDSWSMDIFDRITKEFEHTRFLMQGNDKTNPAYGWLLASRGAIYNHTKAIFDLSAGLASTNTMHTPKTPVVSGTASPSRKGELSDLRTKIRVGSVIFAFEHLWACTILDIDERSDGAWIHVHYIGFEANQDKWIPQKQVVPVTIGSRAFLQQMVKNTFKNLSKVDAGCSETNDKSAHDELPKVAAITAQGPAIKGDTVYVFDNVWQGTVQDRKSGLDGIAHFYVHWKGFDKSGDKWITEHQICPIIDKCQEKFFKSLAKKTYKELATDSPKPKPAHGTKKRIRSKTASLHRPDETPPTQKKPRSAPNIISPNRVSSNNEGSAATAASSTKQRQKNTVHLESYLEIAKDKCDEVIRLATDSDNVDDFLTAKKGISAQMTKTIVEKFRDFPTVSDIRKQYERTQSEGLTQRLKASAIKDHMKRWEEAQHHVIAALDCLIRDN